MLIFCKRACTGGFFKYNKSYIPINLCWSYKFNTLCYLQATFYVIRSICEYYITVKCGNCKNISVCFIRTSTVEIVYPRLYFALAKPSLFNAISSIYKPYLCRIVRISSVSKKKRNWAGRVSLAKILCWHHHVACSGAAAAQWSNQSKRKSLWCRKAPLGKDFSP